MKVKDSLLPLLLSGLLVLSAVSCGQQGNTAKDSSSQLESVSSLESAPSSSLPESSESEVSSQLEPSGSVPESGESEKNTSLPETSQPEESTPDSADASESSQPPVYTLEQERGISDFTMITAILLDYVGVENAESWAKTSYEQGKARNIKTFVDHFQIDYDTFWGIFEDDYEILVNEGNNNLGYQSVEEYMHSYYTDEQLNALFYGDDETIRTAFDLPGGYPIS